MPRTHTTCSGRRVGAMIVAIVVLGAAGCSDDESGGSTTTEPPATSSTATTAGATTTTGGGATDTTPTTSAVDPAAEAVADDLAGAYSGTWTNDTFGSTGSLSASVSKMATGHTLSVTIDLGGNVFGAADPGTESFEIDYTTPSFDVESPVFGAVHVEYHADAKHIIVTADDVPGPNVDTFSMQGTLGGGKLDVTYEVALASGETATGTATGTKG